MINSNQIKNQDFIILISEPFRCNELAEPSSQLAPKHIVQELHWWRVDGNLCSIDQLENPVFDSEGRNTSTIDHLGGLA